MNIGIFLLNFILKGKKYVTGEFIRFITTSHLLLYMEINLYKQRGT